MRRLGLWHTALLAWVAGVVDTFAYLSFGHVFVSHVTGNTSAAAIAVVQRHWSEALDRGALVICFAAGAAIGAWLVDSADHPRQVARALQFEAALLAAFALAIGFKGAVVDEGWGRVAVLVLASLAMGLQNATLVHPGMRGTHTTHLTGPLTDFAVDLVRAVQHAPERRCDVARARRIAGRLIGFSIGAISGGALSLVAAFAAPLAAAAVLIVVSVAELRASAAPQ